MDFSESTQYLYSLGNEVSVMKLGLENMRILLRALENPQNNYLKVQVAGTNGKGSVCAFLDSICNTAGIRTGTFTSPHLISITERTRLKGCDIGYEDFAKNATIVRTTAEGLLDKGEIEYLPTFFEQITAIALVSFAEAKVELAILETGLGGRLDATTAANAEIAAITRIDLDHQEYLGSTIEEIASEKAAIIHAETKAVIIGEQSPEVQGVIESACRKYDITPSIPRPVIDTPVSLVGAHQIENSRTAVEVALELNKYFSIPKDAIAGGLTNARHPGRLEYKGKYLFDGAHNIGGAKALAAYLSEFEKRPLTLVFGAMREKDTTTILSILAPLAKRIIFTEPSNSRSLSYGELLDELPIDITRERTFVTDAVVKAIDIAETVTPVEGIILVTGSLYLVGEVKKILQSQI
jgi:dihydrofolate synthase / folylpolyglutamate synthase